MRFAAIATTLSFLVIAPLAVAIAGPGMDQASFLSAARCAAYENVPAERSRLNAEARRQAPSIVALARADIEAVAHQAATTDPAILRRAELSACASRQTPEV